VGHGRPLHLGADCTLTVIGVGAPVRRTTLGSLVGSFIAWDADVTRDPAVFDVDALPTKRGFNLVGPKHNLLAWTFVVIAEARQGRLSIGEDDELVSQSALLPTPQSNVERFADRQDLGI
jgi:hypothetical protein